MSPLVTLETLQSMVWPDVKLKKKLTLSTGENQ